MSSTFYTADINAFLREAKNAARVAGLRESEQARFKDFVLSNIQEDPDVTIGELLEEFIRDFVG